MPNFMVINIIFLRYEGSINIWAALVADMAAVLEKKKRGGSKKKPR